MGVCVYVFVCVFGVCVCVCVWCACVHVWCVRVYVWCVCVVWCGVCGVVWCGVVWCGVVWCVCVFGAWARAQGLMYICLCAHTLFAGRKIEKRCCSVYRATKNYRMKLLNTYSNFSLNYRQTFKASKFM